MGNIFTHKKISSMSGAHSSIPLHALTAGQVVKIVLLPDGNVRSQFIRVGMSEGERVRCLERLPGGTIIIQKKRQQIAIGHQLAKQVFVVVITEEGHE